MRELRTILLLCAALLVGCPTGPSDQELSPYEDAGGDDAGGDGDGADDAEVDGGDAEFDADPDVGPDVEFDSETDAGANDGEFCQPVGDGVVRRDRFEAPLGQSAPYLIGVDVAVDTAGEEVDGTQTWDFSENSGDDYVESIAIEDPSDYWFGEEFPDATYATKLAATEDEYGIFELTDEALLLLGLATPEDDGLSRTELHFDPPVEILVFPLEEGAEFETESDASGAFGGNQFHSHDETYRSEVDAAGEVVTPYGTFSALRVNTERTVGYVGPFGWTTEDYRIQAFVTECFGTIARVTSEEGEEDEEFDRAAELMRLAQ